MAGVRVVGEDRTVLGRILGFAPGLVKRDDALKCFLNELFLDFRVFFLWL